MNGGGPVFKLTLGAELCMIKVDFAVCFGLLPSSKYWGDVQTNRVKCA